MNALYEADFESTKYSLISRNSICSLDAHRFEEVGGVNGISSQNSGRGLSAQLDYFCIILDQLSASIFESLSQSHVDPLLTISGHYDTHTILNEGSMR